MQISSNTANTNAAANAEMSREVSQESTQNNEQLAAQPSAQLSAQPAPQQANQATQSADSGPITNEGTFNKAINESSFAGGQGYIYEPPEEFDTVIDTPSEGPVQGSDDSEKTLITADNTEFHANGGGDTVVNQSNNTDVHGGTDGNHIRMEGDGGNAYAGEDGSVLVAGSESKNANLWGGESNDTLLAEEGAETVNMNAGGGDDLLYTRTNGVNALGGSGNDKFFASGEINHNTYDGGDNFDTLELPISSEGVSFEHKGGDLENEFTLHYGEGQFLTVTNMEEISFADGTVWSYNDGAWSQNNGGDQLDTESDGAVNAEVSSS